MINDRILTDMKDFVDDFMEFDRICAEVGLSTDESILLYQCFVTKMCNDR